MKYLAIDSSSRYLSLAVYKDTKVISYKNVILQRKLSDRIAPEVVGILKKSGMTLKALDGFAIGLGPGSFTSLRVGVATVKGFVFALNKPVVGISSLDVIAQGCPIGKDIVVISDAKRNMVYSAFFKKDEKGLLQRGEYSLGSVLDVLGQLEADSIIVGDGLNVFWMEVQAYIQKKFKRQQKPQLYPEKYWYPQAKNLMSLALKKFNTKKMKSLDELLPIYLYPSDCQVRK